MVDLTPEEEARIMAVYDGLPSASTPDMPADLQNLIAAKKAIADADRAWVDTKLASPNDTARINAADAAVTAAQDAYLTLGKQLYNAGTLDSSFAYLAQKAEADIAAEAARVAEAARLAEEARLAEIARVAEEQRLADAARYTAQPGSVIKPPLFQTVGDAAWALEELRETLPAQSDNPIIKPLIEANAQGDEAYAAAVNAIIAQHYGADALATGTTTPNLDLSAFENGLRAYQDEIKQLGLLPMTMEQQSLQIALISGDYSLRLASIPDGAAVPPAFNNIITLSRDFEAAKAAPAGTFTDAQLEAKAYDLVQEGFKLTEQKIAVGTWLAERYPNLGQNIDTFFGTFIPTTIQRPDLLGHAAKDVLISTSTLIPGLTVDLPDALIGMLGGGKGSWKSFFGLDPKTSYMDAWQTGLTESVESVTGKPTFRPGTNDELYYKGTSTTLDIGSLVVGGAGIVKAGAKGVKFIFSEAAGETVMGIKDDLLRIFVRAADDVAPVVDDAATTIIKRTDDLVPAPVTHTGKAADDLVTPPATVTDDAATLAARQLADKEAFQKLADDILARLEDATKKPGFWAGSNSRRAALAMMAALPTAGIAAAITEVNSGGAISSALVDSTVGITRAAIKIGMVDATNLESSISVLNGMHALYTWVDKSAQNSAVQTSLSLNADPNSPEAISTAKSLAMGWLLKPDSLAGLVAQHGIRMQLVDDVFPNDKAAADKYLADKFIDNIVERSYVFALGNNQVTREDVKAYLASALNGTDNKLAEVLRAGRLESGLKQIWPDLFTPAVEARPAADTTSIIPPVVTDLTDQATRIIPKVSEQFTAATQAVTTMLDWKGKLNKLSEDMQGMWGLSLLAPIVAFFATVLGMVADFFKPAQPADVVVQTADGGKKLQDVARVLGTGDIVLPNVIDHEGKKKDPIVIEGTTIIPGMDPRLQLSIPLQQ